MEHTDHYISPNPITCRDVVDLVDGDCTLHLSQRSEELIKRCRDYLDEKIARTAEPVYGINTGFGSLCNISIGPDELSQLQSNLVMSHACGLGERLDTRTVRTMLLLKIQSLSYGNSGVAVETVQRLIDFFNLRITPVVYSQGSLGASGDLAPLANMCLPLIGLGEMEMDGAIGLPQKPWRATASNR